jgi:hypothetical protein
MNSNDKTADFIASETLLENKRKVVFQQGRDLNLRDVVEINLDGQWWRVKTADGKLHIVNADKVNYATIA